MIKDENGEPVELDYEGTYNQFYKNKIGYKEQLESIVIGCSSLEFSINDLIEVQAKKLLSKSLEERNKKSFIPIVAKMRTLRFANIISEELYNNLTILFKIRNEFAHKISLTLEKPFEPLKDIVIENDFVKNLPNDSGKFQAVVSYCFTELVYISKKLDPSSVLDLTLVGNITPIKDFSV